MRVRCVGPAAGRRGREAARASRCSLTLALTLTLTLTLILTLTLTLALALTLTLTFTLTLMKVVGDGLRRSGLGSGLGSR